MSRNIISTQNKNLVARQPIVVVMGHIDHGKTTLLDHIRKTSVAKSESGGITQHVGAYEAVFNTKEGETRKITFIDTPGHEAFSKMRSRGAKVADLVILVIAADDGVKPQTSEALETIHSAGIPFVVALNKIDKPDANPEKVKKELSEAGALVEEWGGKIPAVAISAKTGEGVNDLLEVVALVSDLEDMKANPDANASGVVIESHLDSKRGNTATLIIQNGTLRVGEFVASGEASSPVRIFEDFAGNKIKEALFGQPVSVVGFDNLPKVGSVFESFDSKKEAEEYISKIKKEKIPLPADKAAKKGENAFEIPLIIKADAGGSAEAVEGELKKLESEKLKIKMLRSQVGSVNEDDVKLASASSNSIIVGFKVKIERTIPDLAERYGVRIKTFDVIYEITDWLKEEIKNILPEEIVVKEIGRAKILKIFKQSAKDQIIGGKVLSGVAGVGKKFRIARRGNVLGEGRVQDLEQGKKRASQIEEGKEFGMRVISKTTIAEGDEIEIIEEEKIRPEI